MEWALGSLKVWPEAALVGQSFRDLGLMIGEGEKIRCFF